jgi:hypothetical protein
MNYTETFDQFASRLGPTDLALYAGAGIILWILFKDKLSPVQTFLLSLFNKTSSQTAVDVATNKILPTDNILSNIFNPVEEVKNATQEDNFFNLVASWKQTRDLAVKSGCEKAVEVADQMFPFLSPSVCAKENNDE